MWINRQEYERLKSVAESHTIFMERQALDAANNRHELQDRFNECERQLGVANEEIRKLKEMVREQTNADLLVAGLKAAGIIPEKKTEDYAKIQRNLFAQQQMAAGFGQQSGNFLGDLLSR